MIKSLHTYNLLIENIGNVLQQAKYNATFSINLEHVKANWLIGQYIVEFEQHGKERAEYGSDLIHRLSADLKQRLGKGFSRSNLQLMRLFFIKFPNFNTLIEKCQTSSISEISQTFSILSWSHYSELLTISDDLARCFYQKQCLLENWSVRELKRQINSALFQRLALSTNKEGVIALAKKGNEISDFKNIIKDPYIFEFLELPKNAIIKERALEKKLIDNLQQFMLELGKGFSFVARQFKITVDNEHFYVDLVFYHRILKCFVLIELKTRKVKHQDIGQMNLFLNYFLNEENVDGDNEPIGIIIAADKHEYLVQYATGGISNKIFVSKYQLYLPDQRLLEAKVKEILENS